MDVLLGKTADWEVEGGEDVVAWQRYQPADGQGGTASSTTAAPGRCGRKGA